MMDPAYDQYRRAAAAATSGALVSPSPAGGGFSMGGVGSVIGPGAPPEGNYPPGVPHILGGPQGSGAINPGGPRYTGPPARMGAPPNPQLVPPGGGQDRGASQPPAVNEFFQERLSALQDAVRRTGGEIFPFSVGRTPEQQEQLYRRTVDKYGDEKLARQYVSPAGQSRHETTAGVRYGLGPGAIAADLRGDLAIAHRMAALYGLEFGDKNNPWHVSIAGLK